MSHLPNSKPISPAEVFAAGEVVLFKRYYRAQRVRTGDPVRLSNVHTNARESGWCMEKNGGVLLRDTDPTLSSNLLSPANMKRIAIPRHWSVRVVEPGDSIVHSAWGFNVENEAPYRSVQIYSHGKGTYFPLEHFALQFVVNESISQLMRTDIASVIDPSEPVQRGVILTSDLVLDFKDGPYPVHAGGVLIENPKDVDGYTAFDGPNYLIQRAAVQGPGNGNGVVVLIRTA